MPKNDISAGFGVYSSPTSTAVNSRGSNNLNMSLSNNARSSSKNGIDIDLINRYNDLNISNANDRYDDRFDKMLKYNTDMYNNARSWSERMSNTAIQRQVEDLKKAGLNPILAARLGGASYQSPNVPYVNSVANPMYNTFDSVALNSMLDYDASIKQIETQYSIAVLNAVNDMNIAELKVKNDRFIEYLRSKTQLLTTDKRIEADKELQKLDHEFKKMENDKDRGNKIDTAIINGIFRILGSAAVVGLGVATANPAIIYVGAVTGAASLGGLANDFIGSNTHTAGYLSG